MKKNSTDLYMLANMFHMHQNYRLVLTKKKKNFDHMYSVHV